MGSRIPSLVVIGLAAVMFAPPAAAQQAQQQPVAIDNYFPKQLPRGQVTVISVTVPGRVMPQSAEFAPAAGLTITGIKNAGGGQGQAAWWDITVNVASDAAPGPRTLTLVLPMGRRTTPFTFTVGNHAVQISALNAPAVSANRPTVDLQFTAADSANDLGESPYVWFLMRCGPGEPETGMVRGKAADGTVRASIPNPRTLAKIGLTAAAARCDLQTRVIDASGLESNTLNTAVEFRN